MVFTILPVFASAQSDVLQAERSDEKLAERSEEHSLEEYLNRQLDSMTLKLGKNDIVKAFGLPMPIAPSKPVSGDMLTLSGGSPGAQGQYIINGGIYDQSTRFALTVTRPMGAGADYPASVDLHAIGPYFDAHGYLFDSPTGGAQISSLTFAPGETSKTVYLEYSTNITTSYGTNGTEPFFIKLSDPYRAQPEYTLIEIHFSRNDNFPNYNDSYDISSLTASLAAGAMSPYGGKYDVGDIISIGVVFSAWVDITASTTLTMRYSDSSSVTLTPIQTGTTGKVATYLYTVS